MSRAFKWILEEFFQVLPAVVFFFLAFVVINFTTELAVEREGIKFGTVPAIAIGSLVVGKVLLIIDNLRVANAFAAKPLIYNTLWKTFIYSLGALIFRLAEKFIPFVSRYGSVENGYAHFRNELNWPLFWAVQIWVVVLFLFFAILREFIRAFGQDRVRRIFFGR